MEIRLSVLDNEQGHIKSIMGKFYSASALARGEGWVDIVSSRNFHKQFIKIFLKDFIFKTYALNRSIIFPL